MMIVFVFVLLNGGIKSWHANKCKYNLESCLESRGNEQVLFFVFVFFLLRLTIIQTAQEESSCRCWSKKKLKQDGKQLQTQLQQNACHLLKCQYLL